MIPAPASAAPPIAAPPRTADVGISENGANLCADPVVIILTMSCMGFRARVRGVIGAACSPVSTTGVIAADFSSPPLSVCAFTTGALGAPALASAASSGSGFSSTSASVSSKGDSSRGSRWKISAVLPARDTKGEASARDMGCPSRLAARAMDDARRLALGAGGGPESESDCLLMWLRLPENSIYRSRKRVSVVLEIILDVARNAI